MPQYPPQPPAQQQYPTPPAYPQQYPPQQQYAQPQYPPAPVGPPPPAGTLDGFYEQPSSGGGPSFKFQDANRQPQIGKTCVGIVARPVTNADVRAQTNDSGQVQTFKDGRPKFVMVVPMQVQPSPEFPEGQAGWWVKGQARDELARAMAEAGAPAGPPEAGAGIRVTLVGVRPIPGRNPAYQYRVEYVRPANGGPVAQYDNPAAPVAAQLQPAPVQQYAPQPVQMPAPVQQPVQVQQPVPAPQPVVAAPQGAVPAGFSEEQAALFAKLTGG
jgi:hypothetical protein